MKRVRITKPTGRKPMRIGAILLKEVPYQNEWRIQATWRDPDRKKKWFNNWRHAEEFAAKENKRLDVLKERGADRFTGNDACDSYIKKYEDRSQAKDNSGGCTLDTFITLQGIVENHVRPFIGHMRLAGITPRHIEDWLAEQAKIAKPRTVRHRMTELYRVLNYAVERGMLLVPVKKVKPPGKISKRAKIPDRSDLEALREYLTGPRPFRHGQFEWSCLRMIVLLAVSYGLRAGECSALEWDDIDRETGEIDINKARALKQGLKAPKTEAGYRKIPTTPAGRAWIDEHAQVYKEFYGKCVGPVLRSRRRDYLLPQEVSRIFRNAMRACGLADSNTNQIKFTHHAGRHWCASHWMKSTADAHQSAKWLGHKNVSMTLDVYGHCLDDPEAREKFQRIPDWLSPIVELDAPSATRPIALPAPENSFEFDSRVEINGQVEPKCPIDVPSIAEPWVKPLIELLRQGMPILEAYSEISPMMPNPHLSMSSLKQKVQQEFRRLKLPSSRSIVARFRAEKILALHAKGFQSFEIAKMAGCDYTLVNMVLQGRHKPRGYTGLKYKTNSPRPNTLEPQPEHKKQLKLL
jgi:integrase